MSPPSFSISIEFPFYALSFCALFYYRGKNGLYTIKFAFMVCVRFELYGAQFRKCVQCSIHRNVYFVLSLSKLICGMLFMKTIITITNLSFFLIFCLAAISTVMMVGEIPKNHGQSQNNDTTVTTTAHSKY